MCSRHVRRQQPSPNGWESRPQELCLLCSEPRDPFILRDDLYRWIGERLRESYSRAIDELPWDSEEGTYFGATVDTCEALQELELPLDDVAYERVCDDFTDDLWVADAGYDPVPPIEELLGRAPARGELLTDAWHRFCDRVMHQSRYFAMEPPHDEPTFSRVAPGVPDGAELHSISAELDRAGKIRRLDPGRKIFRARTFYDEAHTEPDLLTSPPPQAAAQGRMNAAGVSIFYGALDVETAAAEVFDRSPYVSIALFVTTVPLQVLDLTDPNIDDDAELTAFLSDFVTAISKPVRNDGREHFEYAPTQVMTEYLRHRLGLQGVLFPSSLTRRTNAAIFATQAQCLAEAQAGDIARPRERGQLLEFKSVRHHRYGFVHLTDLGDTKL